MDRIVQRFVFEQFLDFVHARFGLGIDSAVLLREANETPSFEKDLAPSGGELFGSTNSERRPVS